MSDDFGAVADRTARSINTMAVSVAQLLEMHNGVDLRWLPDEKTWHCAQVSPIVWFDEMLFKLCIRPEFGPWVFSGSKVTLTATNGTWIWITTGQTQERTPGINGATNKLIEARWPD